MNFWTQHSNALRATYEDFIYEAVPERDGLVFFSSYDMGTTWTVIRFNELPPVLQNELQNAINNS